jgi:2-polyprenyl-3-methyl-5-hydroxy-6-metoxy-1,4-benzoquinol methylase
MKLKNSISSPLHYNNEYYSTLSTREGTLKKIDEIMHFVELKEGMHILDIGTGRGELAIECARRGCRVKAIDFSPQATELAKTNLKNYGLETQRKVAFEEMDAKEMTYPDNTFDLVFILDLIEHVSNEDLRIIFNQISRVIKPTGKLIVHTSPNLFLVKPIFLLAKMFLKGKEWPSRKYDINEQSYFGLYRILATLGRESKIWMSKKKRFFSRQIVKREDIGPKVKLLASIIDRILDTKLFCFLANHFPLKVFLASDLWAIVDFGRKR